MKTREKRIRRSTSSASIQGKCKTWDPARPDSPGPFGPQIPEESPRESPGPRVQKASETVSEESPVSRNRLFLDSRDSFETIPDTFWTPGPEDSFGDSSGILGPKGGRGPSLDLIWHH